MTKKHYKEFAKILKEARDKSQNSGELEIVRHIITELSKVLKDKNEQFDPEKFEKAIYDVKKRK